MEREYPSDLLLKVFGYLEYPDVVKASSVSEHWRSCANHRFIWLSLLTSSASSDCLTLLKKMDSSTSKVIKENCGSEIAEIILKFDTLCAEKGGVTYNTNLINISEYIEDPINLFKELTLIKEIMEEESTPIIASAIRASSTDDERNQGIDRALEASPNSFWSSVGSADVNSSEFLEFNLDGKFCIIDHVIIHPFMAAFQRGMPVYAPRFFSISVGMDQNSIYYTSKPIEIENLPVPVKISLRPMFIVGKFIRLNLLGKQQTQPSDGLYYTVLQNVGIFGLFFHDISGFKKLLHSTVKFSYLLKNVDYDGLHGITLEAHSEIEPMHVLGRCTKSSHLAKLDSFYSKGNWKEAARYIARNFNELHDFRKKDTWQKIYLEKAMKLFTPIESWHKENPDYYFCRELIAQGKTFNEHEACILASYCVTREEWQQFAGLQVRGTIQITVGIADVLRKINFGYAYQMYLHMGAVDKIIDCCIVMKEYIPIFGFIPPTPFAAHISIVNAIISSNGRQDGVRYLQMSKHMLTALFDSLVVELGIVPRGTTIRPEEEEEILSNWAARS